MSFGLDNNNFIVLSDPEELRSQSASFATADDDGRDFLPRFHVLMADPVVNRSSLGAL